MKDLGNGTMTVTKSPEADSIVFRVFEPGILVEERSSQILPEDALLAVEHIRAGFGFVDVFEVI